MPIQLVTIFVTGAAILALELLASRILTPYFGVSLYIWAGILSITLIALALGYAVGGRLAQALSRERLAALYLALPAVAAAALGLAALAYPWLFPALAHLDLVLGAYLACVLLLLVPLIATSAMNPLLVALRRAGTAKDDGEADAGAGRVFFVSTMGSVAGVPLAAFVLIPHLTNHGSVLLVGSALGALSMAGALLSRTARRAVAPLAALALAFCLGLLATADWRLGRLAGIERSGITWHLEREYGSLFGSVKILRAERGGVWSRVYYQDGILQNRVDSLGGSLSLFTHALEALGMAYKPEAKSALVLGLGAGIVPMRLAGRGIAVEVVEINPASWTAAAAYFHFEPTRVKAHVADARSFVRGCRQAHDLIVIDLFQGDGVPDYLVTQEFFADVAACLKPDGVAVMNSFADLDRPLGYRHLLATAKASFADVLLFRREAYEGFVNSFLVAAKVRLDERRPIVLPIASQRFAGELQATLGRAVRVDEQATRGATPIRDEMNFLGHANAASYMAYRRSSLDLLPHLFLVN
jgi:predicted membrane-bound spermidine synthase